MRGLRFDVQEYRTSHIILRVMQDVIRSLALLVTQPVRLELRWSARVAPQKNTHAGCSNSLSSKAAASEGPKHNFLTPAPNC
jgi:hypothetical protein